MVVSHSSGLAGAAPAAHDENTPAVHASQATWLVRLSAADAVGEGALAASLEQQARELAERFQAAFWCEEIGSYAIALDGRKQQCKVPSSNAGHTLWSGIASPAHADRIVDGLMGQAFYRPIDDLGPLKSTVQPAVLAPYTRPIEASPKPRRVRA